MRAYFLALVLSLMLATPAVAAGGPNGTDVNAIIVAAYQGSGIAQYQLALMLLSGKGVQASPDLATKWLQCSANQGVTEAQYQLALVLLKGKGKTAAYKWLLLSEGKNPDRIALRKQVEADMQPELVSIIAKQATTWRPTIQPLTPYVKGRHPACFDEK